MLHARRPVLQHLRHAAARVARRAARQFVTLGIPKESFAGETRVALTPANVAKLVKKGATVNIERGAGALSGFSDAAYEAQGAKLVDAATAWGSQAVAKVRAPTKEEAVQIGNRMLISPIGALQNPSLVDQLAAQGSTVVALDSLLRTLSKGQAYDILSSQANLAGYRAVYEAAHFMQRPYGGSMTSAGKIQPATVLVCGVGVAGLAAIQTAKKAGAIVKAFDVRAAAAEQAEAAGAQFIKIGGEDGSAAGGYAKEMSQEWFDEARRVLLEVCKTTDVIITTAMIPGRAAPRLITKAMVEAMPAGGVTIDLASEAGGNVETTVPGEVVKVGGVTCVGWTNMPGRIATTASSLFGGNVTNLLNDMYDKDKNALKHNLDEPAVRSMTVVHKGQKLAPYVPPAKPAVEAKKEDKKEVKVDRQQLYWKDALQTTGFAAGATAMAALIPQAGMMSTFALSCWVGNKAVEGVTHALHSPLMSITNAISGMTMVGGMMQLGGGLLPSTPAQVLAATAVTLSSVNLAGGFLVTQKMLAMFQRPDDPAEYNECVVVVCGV
jgi:NAD(P) transhydrogenase